MSDFTHPDLADVTLPAMLRALAEPARLTIVRALADDLERGGEGLPCSAAAPACLPKATMSAHYAALRAAGVLKGRKAGVQVIHRLRREEIDARFPGLLDAILAADGAVRLGPSAALEQTE